MRRYEYLPVDSNYMEHKYTYYIKDNNKWVDEDLFLSHLRYLLIIFFSVNRPLKEPLCLICLKFGIDSVWYGTLIKNSNDVEKLEKSLNV